jgi:hypothetical protein
VHDFQWDRVEDLVIRVQRYFVQHPESTHILIWVSEPFPVDYDGHVVVPQEDKCVFPPGHGLDDSAILLTSQTVAIPMRIFVIFEQNHNAVYINTKSILANLSSEPRHLITLKFSSIGYLVLL